MTLLRNNNISIFMVLLPGFLTLFSCDQQGKQQPKISKETTSGNIYPTGHKLTSQERKDYTNSYLKRKGIPTLEQLPIVEDYKEARFRNDKEVARKAVVLYGLIFVANKEKTSEEIISYFKKYALWANVSPDERRYLEKQNKTDNDNNTVTWRLENLNVLLWALGHFEKLPFPTVMCDFSNYQNLPNLDADPTIWIDESKLRNREEILNETDFNL